MNFNDTPEEARFRRQCFEWLSTQAAPRDNSPPLYFASLADKVSASRQWQHTKAEAGYGAITWPTQYGGMGGSAIDEIIFKQEEAKFLVPPSQFNVSLGMVIPSLMAHASEEVKARHIAPALHGRDLWCQLLSEPQAGSDLGMIKTRATRCEDGRDGWLINGQKVWTSLAQFAEFGMVLTRTNPDAPSFAGMTAFFIDMASPGVEIRPIIQANGHEEFNEVFLTDVFVPDSQRVGNIDAGWKVTMTALGNERMSIGGVVPNDIIRHVVAQLRATAEACQHHGMIERLNALYLKAHGLWLMQCRGLTALSKGAMPGPELATAKIIACQVLSEYAQFMFDLQGSDGIGSPSAINNHWSVIEDIWYGASGMRIAGGTDEIVKNSIGERVLGQAPEPRTDKGKMFRELTAQSSR
jgi:alkylation response protein AidB-like acyl-CoA dehydrogenase